MKSRSGRAHRLDSNPELSPGNRGVPVPPNRIRQNDLACARGSGSAASAGGYRIVRCGRLPLHPQNGQNSVLAAMAKLGILLELWEFLKVRKKLWLLPLVVFLVLLGFLIVFSESSAIAPFIYTLF